MADLDIREAAAYHGLRLLCTGSRDWKDWAAIRRRFAYWIPAGLPSWTTIIHGAQVTEETDALGRKTGEKWGADYIVDQIARELGAIVDPHPADWKRWGKRAGVLRNQEMVDLDKIEHIDACLAWPLGESRGTRDCMSRATLAGIPVLNYGDRS